MAARPMQVQPPGLPQGYWQPPRPFGAVPLRVPPPGLAGSVWPAHPVPAAAPPVPFCMSPAPPPPFSAPLSTPSTALTSPPSLGHGLSHSNGAQPDSAASRGLDRFASTFTPTWLRKVSDGPAAPIPLLVKPRRMSKKDSYPYAEALLPDKFMRTIDAELESSHRALEAQITQMYFNNPDYQVFLRPEAVPANGRSNRLPDMPRLSASSYALRLLPLLFGEHAARNAQLDSIRLYLAEVLVRDRSAGILSLEARSIREGWPPVDLGDTVGLRRLWPESLCGDGYEYEARVTSIRRVDGLLVLHCPQLIGHIHPADTRVPCNVLFKPQDHSFYEMHAAVERLHSSLAEPSRISHHWLFPSPSKDPYLDMPSRIPGIVLAPWHDDELNAEQQHAVRSFVLHRRKQPFLISGAPGSGKTKACVEVVLQILASDPHAHVLLCGASNPSADTLALRLIHHLSPSQLFRLYDPSRGLDEARSPLLPYTHVDDAGYFALPPLAELLKKRVIVSACVDAALVDIARCGNATLQRFDRFVRITMHPTASPPGTPVRPHFTHLVVDEAGQASETELAVPLAVVLPDAKAADPMEMPQVLICGDVKQLPPTTVSDAARKFDFDVSLLQRLLERPFYADNPSARKNRRKGKAVTLDDCLHFVDLVRNYRSHRSILMLPSSLFYNDTLEPCAPATVQNTPLVRWKRLPRNDFPILFKHVDAPEDWIDEGGSWFNDEERKTVVEIIERLVRDTDVRPRQISVISPFREQVWKVRTHLRDKGLGDVDVGNVEALQGAENRVIIISTVRSQQKRRIAEDRERGRGLIFEAQRFNVAMTRAKELLLVVGNAATLTVDPNWRSFYHFTRRNGAYEGPDLPRLPKGSAADISRLEEVFHNARLNGVNGVDVTDVGLLLAGSVVRSLEMNAE